MSELLLEAEKLSVNIGSKTVLDEVSFAIYQGQGWAITGPAGGGKSTLIKTIAGRLSVSSGSLISNVPASAKVILVEQQRQYKNRTDASATYYQARFDSLTTEEFPTVVEALKESYPTVEPGTGDSIEEVLGLLQITYLRHARLIQLSNGENKRFQLAKALLQNPDVLLLDNPFVGLDQATRLILHDIVNQLIGQGITILLITPPTEIPERITHVMELQEGRLTFLDSRVFFSETTAADTRSIPTATVSWLNAEALETMPAAPDRSFEVAIKMQDVTVRYGGRTILDQINWQVNRGEKWALSGPNGAGKSTLLSLIYGDNPQAYANIIHLFDQKKEAVKASGTLSDALAISPELHLYFDRQKTCFKTVASGLTDTMVNDKNLSDAQKAT